MTYTLEAWYPRPGQLDTPSILRTDRDIDEIVDLALTLRRWDYTGAEFYVPELPLHESGFPSHQLAIGIHFEKLIGVVSHWGPGEYAMFSQGDTVSQDEVVYGYMGSERYYPQDSEIPLALVREAVKEFLVTAKRPTCLPWQPAAKVGAPG